MLLPSPELECIQSLVTRFPTFATTDEFDFSIAWRFQLEDGQILNFLGLRWDIPAVGFELEAGENEDDTKFGFDLFPPRFSFLFTKKDGGYEIELLEAVKQEGDKLTFRRTGRSDWFRPL